MPNLRRLSLVLLDVQPDIAIPLIAVPNITMLRISFQDNSSDTYDIIKQHYKLYQLHQIQIEGTDTRYRSSGRYCERAVRTLPYDTVYQGLLGHHRRMVETRQRNVKSMVTPGERCLRG